MKKLRVFEAFSGVGSQRMALRNLGIEHEVVAIADINEHALTSYKAIHGDCPNLGDISLINTEEIPDHDLFTYSFPCQDISVTGKQNGLEEGSGTRSSLLWECQKVIDVKKPKYLLLENVKNLVGKKHKADFDKWLQWLEDQGYTNYWKVMNAREYGVPQNRERVFVVSILNDESGTFTFEQPYGYKKTFRDIMDTSGDYRYITHRPFVVVNKGIIAARFTDSNFESNQRIHSLDGHFQTLCARDRGLDHVFTDDGVPRRITNLERWRLMGFADEDYYKAKEVVPATELAKQAGNSIAVPVLESIFRQMFVKGE